MLDRIDIHVEVPRVAYEKLTEQRLGEASEAVRLRVEAARERVRFAGTDIACNADMRPADVRKDCKHDEAGNALVRTAMAQLRFAPKNDFVLFAWRDSPLSRPALNVPPGAQSTAVPP